MNTYYRLLCALVASLFLFSVSPIAAQNEDCTKIAPTWYAQFDPDERVSSMFNEAMAAKRKALQTLYLEYLKTETETIKAIPTPECLAPAMQRYLDGLSALTEALQYAYSGDATNFSASMVEGLQRIGEFRGYMMAMGADVPYNPPISLYYR